MTAPGRTACTMDCPDACSLLVDRDRNGALRIRGNPDHPFTQGFTCAKIKNHLARLGHPDRVLHPRLRTRSGWETISWDRALDLCAERIQELRGDPAAILHLPSDGAKGVLKRGVGLFFAHLGTSRVRGALCDAAGFIACVNDFGSRENPQPENLLHAGRIVNWGKDLSRSSIHTAALVRRARKRGTRVLTVSPGGDGNGPFSDARIRILPGTDRFLSAAAIRLLLERHRPPDHVIRATRDWEAFREMILSRPMEALIARCGASREDVDKLLRWYSQDEPTATLMGAGLQRYRRGGENARFINALAMLSGNVGRSGGGSHFHLHSFANLNLDWTKVPGDRTRRSFLLPRIGREIREAVDPGIRMLWVNGSNIVNQAPDIRRTVEAFESVPFKVVVDAFMTDTADRADLVLPSTLMLEQEDLVGSYLHPHVQLARPVLPPPGEARDDYRIVSELGERLSPPIHMPSVEEAFRASLDTPRLRTSLEALRELGSVRAQRPDVPYEGLRFAHSDGLYHPPLQLHEEPERPAGYPLHLLTLIRGRAVHSQILPEEQHSPPRVWVSPATLRDHPPGREGTARLVSPLDAMRVRVEAVEGLAYGVVIYRRGDWMKLGGGANRLIADGVTDLGNGAPFYDQHVRLEPDEEG